MPRLSIWGAALRKVPALIRQNSVPYLDWLHPQPRAVRLIALLGVIAAILMMLLWRDWSEFEAEDEQVTLQEERFSAEVAQQETALQASLHVSPQQEKQLAAFSRQDRSVLPTLDVLGLTLSGDIVLLSLDADFSAGRVNLETESNGLSNTLAFAERLGANKGTSAQIQQTTVKTDAPYRPVMARILLSVAN
ncbi:MULTISPECIES: hypothetical protein [Burkholderia]|uniref:Uncharacterized protein n=1 Tax=Burkholderia pyrrocinia TaxID=60550 RepID=A0A318I8U4_BURPY|nr:MULTISPECIES: hypothetical protein [Burkholderia]PXX25818.1 hypothetical protein NA66_102655 [Burkholderia pyrrocinia]SFW83634.1 hypothetical protein SAMN03159384_05780 [Burkholderia sp. NFACC33-1]SFY44809.1 hypothetical protein SAMN03159408_05969 [Burkholderia sp. NFPP32]